MLLVFGSVNVDFTLRVPHLPGQGETVWSDRARAEPGGRGANQAVAAARDGARVTLVGAVGQDHLASMALDGLEAAGITLQVARVPGETGHAAVTVDPHGYTTVAVAPGANLAARADQVEDGSLTRRTTLLVQLETPAGETAALVHRARARGARVILHVSPPRVVDAACLRAAHVLLGNTEELAWLGERLGTGSNPASLRAALDCDVVRMKGVQGVEMALADGYRHVDALHVHMRDTTGASDCFAGVFAGALSRGEAAEAALRRAGVAAALSTTRTGARAGMPDWREIEEALREAPGISCEEPEMIE